MSGGYLVNVWGMSLIVLDSVVLVSGAVWWTKLHPMPVVPQVAHFSSNAIEVVPSGDGRRMFSCFAQSLFFRFAK